MYFFYCVRFTGSILFSTPLTLDDVLEDIYTFLDKHPSETVIFCAKKENRGI